MTKSDNNSSFHDPVLYPHLKITNEEFPRLLATRKILDENDEYFGAYLPATNLRIWIYQLNRIFRLRTCEILIDGTFPKPCQMFFTKQCLAPCVAQICDKETYMDSVRALKLFLAGKNTEFNDFITKKIKDFSYDLEFEKAAVWRDILNESETLKNSAKLQISLGNAVDTYNFEEFEDRLIIYLVTTRGRKFAGNFEFVYSKLNKPSIIEIFTDLIKKFYLFHLPKEIRLPIKLLQTKDLTDFFVDRFGKNVKISFHKNDLNLTAKFRMKRTKMEFELDRINEKLSPEEIQISLKEIFKLPRIPVRIECFDVAHISNQNFVAASAVYENGRIRPEFSRHFILEVTNELDAMALGIRERLSLSSLPDFIIIDGGKSQLARVQNEIKQSKAKNISVISAVKPPRKHKEISHLLTAEQEKINFIEGDRSFELIRELRDEAHRAANDLFRQLQENQSIFGQMLPLVPIRYYEINGAAEDLIPIKSYLIKT